MELKKQYMKVLVMGRGTWIDLRGAHVKNQNYLKKRNLMILDNSQEKILSLINKFSHLTVTRKFRGLRAKADLTLCRKTLPQRGFIQEDEKPLSWRDKCYFNHGRGNP